MAKQVKKPTKQQHLRHQKQHRIIVGLSIVVVAALIGLIFSLIIVPKVVNDTRLHRINEIYNSIQIPVVVYDETDNVFGNKRWHEEDNSKTYASSKTFVVGETVTEATDTFDKAIAKAGYMLISQSTPGAVSNRRVYKTPQGEYVFLRAESKLRLDAFQNQIWMKNKSNDFSKIDPNAGPARVTLSVNLDDNNE